MSKEDNNMHLQLEMGKLEINPVIANSKKKYGNPFGSLKYLCKKPSTQRLSCSCSFQKKKTNDFIGKEKHKKILKDATLQVIKTCVVPNILKTKHKTIATENETTDTLNLCTLVKTCNELKISSSSSEHINENECNDLCWWKNEVDSSKRNKEQRSSNPAGSCSQQALNPPCDVTIDELASYFETLVHIPKKMSSMAEMMYI